MTDAPTPKTDAWVMNEYGDRPNKPLTASECLDFARRLERERDALRRKLGIVKEVLRVEGSVWPEKHPLNVALKQIEAEDAIP